MSVKITPQNQTVHVSAPTASVQAKASVIQELTPVYSGPTIVEPSSETQTLETMDLKMPDNVTVEAIPGNYVGPDVERVYATTIEPGIEPTIAVDAYRYTEGPVTIAPIPSDFVGSSIPRLDSDSLTFNGNTVHVPSGYFNDEAQKEIPAASWRGGSALERDPSITVGSDGLISASYDSTIPVTPLNGSGWADKTRTYPVRTHGSKTQQLPVLSAATYTPGASQIIIPQGKFLTGDQTIEAVAPPYYDMSGSMAWLGKGAELVDGNLYSATFKLSDTGWSSWTPGSTAGVLVASVTQSAKFTASDMANNEYAIIWECGFDPVWDGTETLKALPLLSRAYLVQQIFRRPNSWALIQASDFNANTCASAFTGTFMRYYGTTTGTATYTYAASYGFYFSIVASTFSSATSDNPTVTLKTPTMSARCNTTYFSTSNAPKIDTDKSTGYIRGKLYRIKRDGFLRGIYNNVVRLINEE